MFKFPPLLIALALLLLATSSGYAVETAHWGGFPTAIGAVAEETTKLYNFIFWIITVVFFVVTIPLLYIIFKFRASNNTKPAKFSHHIGLEILWTTIPAIICVALAWKSFDTLVFVRTIPEEGLTIEAVGYQFGWDFYYPDFAEGSVNLAATPPETAHPTLSLPEQERFVPEFVIPIHTPIKIHTTSKDVIHAFYAPDVGVKIDSMPGRINYAWFTATRTGDFIGQCAELCGSAHGEMFFTIKAVEMPEFVTYINTLRTGEGLAPLPSSKILAALNLSEAQLVQAEQDLTITVVTENGGTDSGA